MNDYIIKIRVKPDWKHAPDWANFLAMDGDGEWYWYAACPRREGGKWRANAEYTRLIPAEMKTVDWKKSLEERPTSNPVIDALFAIARDCADYHDGWAEKNQTVDPDRAKRQADRATSIRIRIVEALKKGEQ